MEELLRKYIEYVALVEGSNFIGVHWSQRDADEVGITEDEKTILRRLAKG